MEVNKTRLEFRVAGLFGVKNNCAKKLGCNDYRLHKCHKRRVQKHDYKASTLHHSIALDTTFPHSSR